MANRTRYNYLESKASKNRGLLWDLDVFNDFVCEFFTTVLSITRKPVVISLKIKFSRSVDRYRSATKNFIVKPFNSGLLWEDSMTRNLSSFKNFMLMVDLFLKKRDEEYDIEDVEDIFIEYWEVEGDKMLGSKVEAFNQKVFNKKDVISSLKRDTSNLHKQRVDIHPSNMDIESWFRDEKHVLYVPLGENTRMINRNGLIYTFMISEDRYICSIMLPHAENKEDAVISRFIDVLKYLPFKWDGGPLNTFSRYYFKNDKAKDWEVFFDQLLKKSSSIDPSIIDRVYVYTDGVLDSWKAYPPTKYITSLSRDKKVKGRREYTTRVEDTNPLAALNYEEKELFKIVTPCKPKTIKSKIVALDLETRTVETEQGIRDLEVISACWTNGSIEKSFYVTDYMQDGSSPIKPDKLLIKDTIDSLLSVECNGFNVYCHNLSSFDGVFILKSIFNLTDEGYNVDLISKDSKLIIITISKVIHTKDGDINFKIRFYDSLLILPVSLSKLAPSFGVSQGKLDWDTSTHDTADLNDPKFRADLLNYNMVDCKVLHNVIYKFYQECKKEFKINILNCPTLPSIAFKLFRTKFLSKEHSIGITWLEQYDKLNPGYRGGHVDVYKPYGKDLYYYDINSLYPFVMSNLNYPIGDPYFFANTSPKPLTDDLFGVVMAKVKAPNIKAPILLHSVETNTSSKILAPIGSWEGIYCTEELRNAMKYGYEVQVLWGYQWDMKARVFEGYIKTLYNNRLKYPKSDPRNLISKLMLNSLYGRFGLSPYLSEYRLLKDISDIHGNDFIALDNNKFLVETEKLNNSYIAYKDSVNRKVKYSLSQISLPIAMFVTAYARMVMSKYKVQYADNLYYSDTDSIVLDKPLPSEVVSDTQLGLFKLEHEISEGVFLAPKVYAFKSKSGEYVCKIKGSKHKIDFDTMKSLLIKDSSHQIEQSKWYRSLEKANITIKDQFYKLATTENKRVFIYKDNRLIDTKPVTIEINNPSYDTATDMVLIRVKLPTEHFF